MHSGGVSCWSLTRNLPFLILVDHARAKHAGKRGVAVAAVSAHANPLAVIAS